MQIHHLASTILLLAACSRESAPTTDPTAVGPAERARGAAIIGELKKSLVGALTKAMASGVPAAIEVCHTEAPTLAAGLARDGVIVGRATRKPRNPKNVAAGWRVDAIVHFEELQSSGSPMEGASFARRLPDGRIAYAEPLVIQSLCLACHGTTLAPEVQQTLAAKYPEDRATGYQLGDLRGVAWVELPAPR